jgi:sugar/nucleoside kinase (ribokinase family)
VAGHGDGESRFVESRGVTDKLQAHLHLFDLIVGTEDEFHIAGGSTDTIAALRAVRAVSKATLVCKRGAAGAVAFTCAIPDSLDAGESGPGFRVEVFKVMGAGDGFMSGLSRAGSKTCPGATHSAWPMLAAPSPSAAIAAHRLTLSGGTRLLPRSRRLEVLGPSPRRGGPERSCRTTGDWLVRP